MKKKDLVKKALDKSISNSQENTHNNNSEVQPVTNKKFEFYKDMFSFKTKPVTEAYIEKVALEMIDWAINDSKALKISQFYTKRGINYSDYHRWMSWSENLKLAHEFASQIIGDRREEAAYEKKASEGIVMYTMPRYDREWKELTIWRNELKQKLTNKDQNITVLVDHIPNSNLVPEKKVESTEDNNDL